MTAYKQDSPYPIRAPAELKLLIQTAASVEGLSTNAWLVHNLSRSIWAEDPGRYLIPIEAITLRAEKMLPFNPRFDTSIALRMPPELRELVTGISKSNHRSLAKELCFRLIALIAEADLDQVEQQHDKAPSLASHALSKAWSKLDNAIKGLESATIATMGAAVERLEAERRTFDEVVRLFKPGNREG